MNAKRFYRVLAIILGYGLIIGGFIVFGESLENEVKILDIIVSCLLYSQIVLFTFSPLIDLDNPSNKEVGMLGIHLVVLTVYCILSLALMVCGIKNELSFSVQLLGQLAIIFLLLLGRLVILHSGDKVQQIYEKEQCIMSGKTTLKRIMDDFMDELAYVKDFESSNKQRLEIIHEDLRFITPSTSVDAKNFDSQFIQSVNEIKVLMRDANLNKSKISEEIDRLERIINRRKNNNT